MLVADYGLGQSSVASPLVEKGSPYCQALPPTINHLVDRGTLEKEEGPGDIVGDVVMSFPACIGSNFIMLMQKLWLNHFYNRGFAQIQEELHNVTA